ncbi:MAG TPA: molecular chaperone DnaJ [Candidatus Dormibacteraeota bacterium]
MPQTKRDYYEVLGVDRQATSAELKRAYRALAMKFHPDRNAGDQGAEDRFKEIGEAYQVLSDPDRRQRYDTFGHAGEAMGGAQGFNFQSAFDLFDMFFSGGAPGQRRRGGPRRGNDLQLQVTIDFEEAIRGVTRTFELTRQTACPECGGSGAKGGTASVSCPDCGGQGQVQRVRQSLLGQMVTVEACPRCQGEGTVIESPCPSCHGQGVVEAAKEIEVQIPPGVDNEMRVRVPGEGAAGPRRGPTGDLYLLITVRPDEELQRRGMTIVYECPITFSQAALGDTIEVPTVDGPVSMVVKPGSQYGQQVRIPGKGAPDPRTGRRGDQVVRLRVVIPTRLSERERELLLELSPPDGKPHPVRKGFFENLKDAIGL